MAIYYPPTSNFVQKTLGAELLSGVTAAATLNNVTSIQNKKGVMIIDRIDANGQETPSKVEVVPYTGTSGSTVVTLTRGQAGTTDQDHAVGAIVEFGPDIIWAQGLIDTMLVEHNEDGTHSDITATSVTTDTITAETTDAYLDLNGNGTGGVDVNKLRIAGAGVVVDGITDEDDMASDSATKVPTQQSVKAYVDNIGGSAWTSYTAVVPTRASADDPTYVLTFAGVDLTSSISPGMRIKWTQNSIVRYGIVTAISFSTNTTMTVYGGTDYDVEDTGTHVISGFAYSSHKAPVGFPLDPLKWTQEVVDTSDRSQSTPTSGVWYNLGSVSLSIPIGAWSVEYFVVSRVAKVTTTEINMWTTLSTGNNNESDVEMTSLQVHGGASGNQSAWQSNTRSKSILLGSKTTYYLNAKSTSTPDTIVFAGSTGGRTIIRAICAYL